MIMWYDVLALGILLFFALRGAMRGFIFQIASIAGIVLCFVFADAIANAAGPYVHLDPPMNHWVVLVASYLIFTFLCFLAARMLNEWLEKCKLKEFDRHLGVAFGLVKGVVLVMILTFFIVTVSESARTTLKGSQTGRYCAILMDRLEPILPQKMHVALEDYIHLLDSPDLPLIHSHAPFPDDADSDFDLGTPSSIPGSSQSGSTPPANSSLWAQLQAAFSKESQHVVSKALESADPQTRSKLEQSLSSVVNAIPAEDRANLQQQIIQVGASQLQDYLDWKLSQLGQPVSPTPTNPTPMQPTPVPSNPTTGATTNSRIAVIREIASVYSSLPNIRQNIEQDIQRRIAGVPDSISDAALIDWKVDLLRTGTDPDPNTGPQTPVELRILSQMQKQGMRIEQLAPEVQQRLRAAQAQASSFGNPL